MKSITLPKGLRIEVVDNTNLTVPVGTKATLTMEETIRFNSITNTVFAAIDGDDMVSGLPFEQCKIITDNFKKTFKPKRKK
jgi:hypothetical protein